MGSFDRVKPRLPTTPLAFRIGDIFHRKHSTPWDDKEIAAYKKLLKKNLISFPELEMIERCYREQWPPRRDKNILRHDLLTFLNNYTVERDRAVIYCESHPTRTVRKIIPIELPSEQPPIEVDPETRARFLAQYAEHKAAKRAGESK